jgi:CRISPR-associated protein Cas6
MQPGVLELSPASAITLRSPAELLPSLLPLGGRKLELGGCAVRLGVPQLFSLTPAEQLGTRVATIKGYTEPDAFAIAVRKQLDALGVGASVGVEVGPRRVIRICEKTIIGFRLILAGLSDEESLEVQEHGIGGRRHLGCGLFVPCRQGVAGETNCAR